MIYVTLYRDSVSGGACNLLCKKAVPFLLFILVHQAVSSLINIICVLCYPVSIVRAKEENEPSSFQLSWLIFIPWLLCCFQFSCCASLVFNITSGLASTVIKHVQIIIIAKVMAVVSALVDKVRLDMDQYKSTDDRQVLDHLLFRSED